MSNAFDEKERKHLYTYPVKSLWLIALCFILSGATGLIYEVLWARMLGLVFGATTFAISTVLAAFMGGLALGSAWAGRLAARIKRPLRAYAHDRDRHRTVRARRPSALRAGQLPVRARLGSSFVRAFTVSACGASCSRARCCSSRPTLMGATLPVLSAALMRSPAVYVFLCGAALYLQSGRRDLRHDRRGLSVAPALGVSLTIYTAAAINIVVGIVAFLHRFEDTEAF